MASVGIHGGASSGGGGGGAVTVADGADIAEGATTDAAVITDTTGTISGKLRGLVKWAFERMPASLGQKTMANSLPVVLASDQSVIPAPSTASNVLDFLNEAVSIAVVGNQTVGFHALDTAFSGTLSCEISMDGGATWSETDYYNPLSGYPYNRVERYAGGFSSDFVISTAPGVTNARVRVQTYTSGSVTVTLSATSSPFIRALTVGPPGSFPQAIHTVGGRYQSITGPLYSLWLDNAAPVSNAIALVVRNIPSGTQNIAAAANTTASGTLVALNGTVTMATAGLAGIGLQITGVWVATIKLQGTIDGVNWENITPYIPATRLFVSTGTFITANGIFTANIAPYASVRVLASAYTSGTATINFAGSVISVTPSITASVGVTGSSAMIPLEIATTSTPIDVILGAGTSIIGVVSSKIDLTPSAPATVAVGVASALAVAAAATRKGLSLRNTSTSGQRISLGLNNAAAVLDSGITLYPQDVFQMDEYCFDLGQVNAISSAASGALAIQELTT